MENGPDAPFWSRRAVLGAVVGGVGLAASARAVAGSSRGGLTSPIARDGLLGAVRIAPPRRQRGWTTATIGTSALGRPIEGWTSAAPVRERRRILVVAAVHGNEPVTRPIAAAIAAAPIPDDVTLVIVPTMNPDGWAASMRRNAQGIDLNRNFPWRFPGGDGGRVAGSAPETQAVMALVANGRFDASAWIHQPLGYVGPIASCPKEYADAWCARTGSPRRDGIDQQGGGETWCARAAGVPTILVEANSWASTPQMVAAHVTGFRAFVDVVVAR